MYYREGIELGSGEPSVAIVDDYTQIRHRQRLREPLANCAWTIPFTHETMYDSGLTAA